jgi:ubiquinone/menaquinone biosynthesis C-methylase UbiE
MTSTRPTFESSTHSNLCTSAQRPAEPVTSQPPGPGEVGTMYDQLTDIFARCLGDNLHFGYWENEEDDSPIETATDRLTNLVAERLELSGPGRVLDVGCGSGKASIQISAKRGLHVTGITVSHHQLQLARARRQDDGLAGRASFQLADAMELPFDDCSFDGAYAIESILHMRNKNAVFGHLARVLRPGARLIVADLYQDGEVNGEDAVRQEQLNRLFQNSPLITADMYRKYVHRAGLRLVEFTDIRTNVQRSYRSLVAAARKAAANFGGEISSQLSDAAQFVEQSDIISKTGYMLLTATRP